MKHTVVHLLLSTLMLSLPVTRAQAAWPIDGEALCTAANGQSPSAIVSDAAGGAIVTWQDFRNGTHWDIYARRIDAAGNALWTADGVALCTAADFQESPQMVSDGAGGAIVTWQDFRNGNFDIYARRIDATGNALWTANGVALCTAATGQNHPTIVSDGAGGAIVTWHDNRSGTNTDIYAQRINATGNVLWTANGVAVSTAASNQLDPTIESDGAGGAIVTWRDRRSGTNLDIYAQRIDATGSALWTLDGVALCTATGDQEFQRIVSDGAGGAIVTWQDPRSGFATPDIYARRIDATGNALWTADGVALCTATNAQYFPTIVSDGSGGAIVTWSDRRSDANGDIYAQRIDATGNTLWTANGVALCTAANGQSSPTIDADGAGGAIVTWQDRRSGNFDIYAQRTDATGNALWLANGIALCTAADFQGGPMLVSDGAGGGIVAWGDSRSGTNDDIYAQRVSAGGLTATDVGDTPSSAELVVHNFPNPFTGATEVQVWLPAASQVEIDVFDPTGRRVRHEAIGGTQGWQRMRWDGYDGGGRRLANGVYFYRVKTARETLTHKMVIAR